MLNEASGPPAAQHNECGMTIGGTAAGSSARPSQKRKKLTEDCEGENHVPHDLVAQAAAHAISRVHSGRLQVALVHPDLHLLLHFVGTESRKERR